MLSPDTSLVRLDRWQTLTPEQRRGFAPLCPDLVVEMASPGDEGPRALTALRSKMAAYLGLIQSISTSWALADASPSPEVP